MIVPVIEISNLVLSQQIYSEETNGAHAHNRDRVHLKKHLRKRNGNITETRSVHGKLDHHVSTAT